MRDTSLVVKPLTAHPAPPKRRRPPRLCMDALPHPQPALVAPTLTGSDGPSAGVVRIPVSRPSKDPDSEASGAIMEPQGVRPAVPVPAAVSVEGDRGLWRPGGERQHDAQGIRAQMTPAEVAGHVARRSGLTVPRGSRARLARRICGFLVNDRQWARAQLVNDIFVLCLAS